MTFKEYMNQELATSNDKINDFQRQIEALDGYKASLPDEDSQEKQQIQKFIDRKKEFLFRLKEIAESSQKETTRVMILAEKIGQR